jgi:hypothetical protein
MAESLSTLSITGTTTTTIVVNKLQACVDDVNTLLIPWIVIAVVFE